MLLDNREIFEESLANHSFFASSIRSFCTAIGLTFFKNNQDYIDRAVALGRRATEIINLTISYMSRDLANETIENEVYITKYTEDIDLLTQELFGVDLEMQLDKDLQVLRSRGNVEYNNATMEKIDKLNNQALILINDFQSFCQEIITKLDNQDLFSYLYPDYFDYMVEQSSVYKRDLERILSKKDYSDFYLKEYAFYFNELLRKSAEYIRGFLDTSHQDVFDMATYYITAFTNLGVKYLKNTSDNSLNEETIRLVTNYKSFVENTIERLLRAEIYFITPPVVLDDFLTNVNVYLFILNIAKNIINTRR